MCFSVQLAEIMPKWQLSALMGQQRIYDTHFLPQNWWIVWFKLIEAQIAGVLQGCARVHSGCCTPQVVKTKDSLINPF